MTLIPKTPMIPKINFVGLTGSQFRSAVLGGAGAITTLLTALYSLLKALGAVPGIHLPAWFAVLLAVISFILMLTGQIVSMFSRSLDKSNSGNGAGLVGNPKVDAVIGEVVDLAGAGAAYIASPAGSAVVTDVVSMLDSGLSQPNKLKWQALGLSLLSDEHSAAADNLTLQGISRAALATGHAAIADTLTATGIHAVDDLKAGTDLPKEAPIAQSV